MTRLQIIEILFEMAPKCISLLFTYVQILIIYDTCVIVFYSTNSDIFNHKKYFCLISSTVLLLSCLCYSNYAMEFQTWSQTYTCFFERHSANFYAYAPVKNVNEYFSSLEKSINTSYN